MAWTWGYDIFEPPDPKAFTFKSLPGMHSIGHDFHEALRRARNHLVQNACNPFDNDDCIEAFHDAFAPAPAFDLQQNDADLRSHMRWCDWQRRFRTFRDAKRLAHATWTEDYIRSLFDRTERGQVDEAVSGGNSAAGL
jgi:hypothetical protein